MASSTITATFDALIMIKWIKKNAPESLKKNYKLWRFKCEIKNTNVNAELVSHLVKQQRIFTHSQKYKLQTLVETGTYLGEMVSAMRYFFESIYSIELSEKLAKEAQELFKTKPSIQIIQGDSSIQLEKLIPNLKQPTLFWLDGHYSGGQTALGNKECPILEELDAILQFKYKSESAILIDDARLFNGTNDYPTTKTIENWVAKNLPSHSSKIEYDAICILPKTSSDLD